jgi:hypothetical protein
VSDHHGLWAGLACLGGCLTQASFLALSLLLLFTA